LSFQQKFSSPHILGFGFLVDLHWFSCRAYLKILPLVQELLLIQLCKLPLFTYNLLALSSRAASNPAM